MGAEPVSATTAGPIAAGATVLASALRNAGARPLVIDESDLRTARREQRSEHVVILAIDTSGSMGVAERVEAARGAVLALVADAYQRRDRVAVIAYRDQDAQVVLRPTSSTEVALARLAEVATGGRTPLAAGIEAARALGLEERRRGAHPVLVVVTDGRATFAPDGIDPVVAALAAATACRTAGFDALVVDCEASPRALGVARAVADEMGARYVAIGSALGQGGADAELAAAISASIH
jgi:magnesium chelatase subunit D